ncbi:MAG: peroxiredoxin, partial [Planctomycetota bacterium]
MVHPGAAQTATVRAVFVIDPTRTVRALVYYPLNVGRSVDEIVRLIDGLQTSDAHACATPVEWRPGQNVVVPPPKTAKEVLEREAKKSEYEHFDFYLNKREL